MPHNHEALLARQKLDTLGTFLEFSSSQEISDESALNIAKAVLRAPDDARDKFQNLINTISVQKGYILPVIESPSKMLQPRPEITCAPETIMHDREGQKVSLAQAKPRKTPIKSLAKPRYERSTIDVSLDDLKPAQSITEVRRLRRHLEIVKTNSAMSVTYVNNGTLDRIVDLYTEMYSDQEIENLDTAHKLLYETFIETITVVFKHRINKLVANYGTRVGGAEDLYINLIGEIPRIIERFDRSFDVPFAVFVQASLKGYCQRHYRDQLRDSHGVSRRFFDAYPKIRMLLDKKVPLADIAVEVGISDNEIEKQLLRINGKVNVEDFRSDVLDDLVSEPRSNPANIIDSTQLDDRLASRLNALTLRKMETLVLENIFGIVCVQGEWALKLEHDKMTQTEVAIEAGVSQVHIGRIMKRFQQLFKVALTLD